MSWEVLDESTLSKIKEQKFFEDETSKKLMPLYESAKNPIIKLYIHSIILDTMRHSDTYQMLMDLNERAQVGEESAKLGEQELKSHIVEEAKMLAQTEQISKAVKDKRIKQILLSILEDEQKHHRVLNELMKILKKESKEWDAYLYDLMTGFP
ncbi:MAG TPA: ferritin-like domain-containing protein [Candidatus Acidoferrum sp.]|nr:ferritin-like domain-containing protein [Candidatus Acidoferrum sp.]